MAEEDTPEVARLFKTWTEGVGGSADRCVDGWVNRWTGG